MYQLSAGTVVRYVIPSTCTHPSHTGFLFSYIDYNMRFLIRLNDEVKSSTVKQSYLLVVYQEIGYKMSSVEEVKKLVKKEFFRLQFDKPIQSSEYMKNKCV